MIGKMTKIIVKKKWKDNKTNAEREKESVIHITTNVNKVPTYAEWRDNYSNTISSKLGPFYYVDSNYQSKTKKVAYADVSADHIPTNAVRLDKNYSDPVQDSKSTDGCMMTVQCTTGRMRKQQS